jgi:hypothetical protein
VAPGVDSDSAGQDGVAVAVEPSADDVDYIAVVVEQRSRCFGLWRTRRWSRRSLGSSFESISIDINQIMFKSKELKNYERDMTNRVQVAKTFWRQSWRNSWHARHVGHSRRCGLA